MEKAIPTLSERHEQPRLENIALGNSVGKTEKRMELLANERAMHETTSNTEVENRLITATNEPALQSRTLHMTLSTTQTAKRATVTPQTKLQGGGSTSQPGKTWEQKRPTSSTKRPN